MKKCIKFIAATTIIMLLSGCVDSNNENTTAGNYISETESVTMESQHIGVSVSATTVGVSESKEKMTEPSSTKFVKTTRDANATTTRQAVASTVGTTRRREPNTFSQYNNSGNYNDIITKSYNESDIVAKYIMEECWDLGRSERITFEMINLQFPAECIRKSGDNVYALYKTKQGGHFYVFFDEGMEIKHCAYSEKRLSYADFAGVKAGQSVADIEKIDPTVATLKKYWYRELEYAATTHILTDGVLRIIYRKSPQTGEFTVWKAAYSKDFIFDYKTAFENDTTGAKLDYSVLSTDYVS